MRPNVPLARQEEQDLLWIRDEFNDFRGAFEKMIVHGHTPVAAPEILPNRINIDTGAYATDVLTCLGLGRAGTPLHRDVTTWIDAARIEAIGRSPRRARRQNRPVDRAARSVSRSRRAAAIIDQWRIGGRGRLARPPGPKGAARLVVVWRPKDGRVARARFWLFEHWRFRESG